MAAAALAWFVWSRLRLWSSHRTLAPSFRHRSCWPPSRSAPTPSASAIGQGDDRQLGVFQRRPRQDLHRHLQERRGRGRLKVEFEPNCAELFPFMPDIAGWRFPDNDLLVCSTPRASRCSNSARSRAASTRRRRPAKASCFSRMQRRRRRRRSRRPDGRRMGRSCAAPARRSARSRWPTTAAGDDFAVDGQARLRCGDRAAQFRARGRSIAANWCCAVARQSWRFEEVENALAADSGKRRSDHAA